MTMKKIFTFLLFGILTFYSCKEGIIDNPIENKAPNTSLFLYLDSSISKQRSRLTIHWWGDDPDGLVVGFYFKWLGLDSTWHFTTKNDSTFSLPIGTADTTYTFVIAAADNSGNNKYDHQVIRNGINFGSEPFTDLNGNNLHDNNEPFVDIGLIDPSPAKLKFPISNSAPEVQWNKESILPPSSLPVVTIAWEATDLDGNSTITSINIALNDTNKAVSLDGSVRLVTLVGQNFSSDTTTMKILIDGSPEKIYPDPLPNLLLNAKNKIYIQAVDISGAKSRFISLPDSSSDWFVEKPKGDLLIIDDYPAHNDVEEYYRQVFSAIGQGTFKNKFNVFNLETTKLSYEYTTFLQMISLFKYVFWYSSSTPSIDLANLVTQKYLQSGGHLFYSMTFKDSSDTFPLDLQTLQNFLPIDSLGEKKPLAFLFPGAQVLGSSTGLDLPQLQTTATIGFVRTFYPANISAIAAYDISSRQITGNIAFINKNKNLFFIGLPLHLCDGIKGNVNKLLEKIFFDQFNAKK